MSEHSQISPSMLHRIMGDEPCFASVQMQADIPEPPSSAAAMAGTQLHELAEQVLNGVIETDSEIVNDYVDYVYDVAQGNKVYAEVRVSLEGYVEGMFGTADAVVIDREARTMHVIDLKTGQHSVSADENPQLMAYALGALEEFDLNEFDIDTVRLHIAQPPINNYSTYDIDLSDLTFFGDELQEAAMLSYQSDPAYGPTESNCRFCKAAGACPALEKKMVEVVGKEFQPIAPEKLTDDQISLILERKRDIEFFLRSVYEYASNRAQHGDHISGWKLVEGRRNRQWGNEAKTALYDILGEDAFDQKLIGVGKAEKLIGKETVDALTYRPKGNPSLVRLDDPRPSVSAADMFDNLNDLSDVVALNVKPKDAFDL